MTTHVRYTAAARIFGVTSNGVWLVIRIFRWRADFSIFAQTGLAALLFCCGLSVLAVAISPTGALADSSCYTFANVGESGPDGMGSFSCEPRSATTVTTTTGESHRWDTTAYVGVSLPIGEAFNPHFDFGVRETNVGTSGFVYGVEANSSVSLLKGLQDSQVRLLGVVGGTLLQGTGGVGWDVGHDAFMLNIGLQVPYVRGFLDYHLDDKTLRAAMELNTIGAIRAAQQMTEINQSLGCAGTSRLDTASQALADLASFLGFANPSGSDDIFNGRIDNSPGPGFFAVSRGTPSSAWTNGQTCFSTHLPPS
jgi:hypothetical protein